MSEKPISRRSVLKGGLAAGAALAVGAPLTRAALACPPPRRPGSRPQPHLPPGTDTLPQIEHIVVLMLENHSYDNYFGTLGRPGADGFTCGRDGKPTASNPYPNGDIQHAFAMPTTCQLDAKPSQAWLDSHIQYDGGRNDGFVRSASGPVAMGYWTASDLPFYHGLARTFPVGDRWFCSAMAQTYPNRRYLMAATSFGQVSDTLPGATTYPPNGTIFDRLDAYGITWKDYFSDLATADLFPPLVERNPGKVVPIADFFNDVAAGSLPGFSIVDPMFNSKGVGPADVGGTSEEDPQNIAAGEAFSSKVVNAVLASPSWPKTLLIYTYDEHGGYYDHVPPPRAVPPDNIGPDVPANQRFDGFARYGFRVPAVVVSPYARPGYVSHVVHDHTSILKLVETKWNLPALTYRDANASNLLDFVDLRRPPPFLHPPALPAPGVQSTGGADLACSLTGPGTIPPPGSVSGPSPRR